MTRTTDPLRCKRCGCPAVRWMQTNAGRWYLAARTFEPRNPAYAGAMRKVPHNCDAHRSHHSVDVEEHQARYYARQGVR